MGLQNGQKRMTRRMFCTFVCLEEGVWIRTLHSPAHLSSITLAHHFTASPMQPISWGWLQGELFKGKFESSSDNKPDYRWCQNRSILPIKLTFVSPVCNHSFEFLSFSFIPAEALWKQVDFFQLMNKRKFMRKNISNLAGHLSADRVSD